MSRSRGEPKAAAVAELAPKLAAPGLAKDALLKILKVICSEALALLFVNRCLCSKCFLPNLVSIWFKIRSDQETCLLG